MKFESARAEMFRNGFLCFSMFRILNICDKKRIIGSGVKFYVIKKELSEKKLKFT